MDGCPALLDLTEADIQPQLTRRRPGQSALTTPRDEKDLVQIHSGTEHGVTLGTPIMLLVKNEDQRPKDYGKGTMDAFPRPGHAVRILFSTECNMSGYNTLFDLAELLSIVHQPGGLLTTLSCIYVWRC